MRVKIYNTSWLIKWVSFDELLKHWNKHRDEPDGNDIFLGGLCNKGNRYILINREYTKEQQRESLIHELTHAIKHVSSIDSVDSIDEELLCSFISHHYDELTKILSKVLK